MAELPVSRREVHRIYSDLAEDVSARERRLGDELPVDTTAEIPARLSNAITDWESGRKSLRTVPACNVYARYCDGPVDESVKRTLTGLDATVNALDDIIDTQELTTQSKIRLTANAAFSATMMVGNCPPEFQAEVTDSLLDYFTTVFQIPLVEREVFKQMEEATSVRQRQTAAETFYAYRARDIDVFARLPAIVMDVTPEDEQRLLEDLRAYRCRRLLFKDIRDVKRDLADGDTTPLIYLLETCETAQDVTTAIEDLYARFTYSDAGQQCYGDILEELENPPDDLQSVIRHIRETVDEPSKPPSVS